MSTKIQPNPATQEQGKKHRRGGTLLWVLLAVIVILLIVTTILLGSRLYEVATRDQYTVDLLVGEAEEEVELFRIEYANKTGEITVQGTDGQNVVAPGTTVDYDIRLRNKDDVVIDFMVVPEVEFLTEDKVPVEFKMVDAYGNYILGDEDTWATPEDMNVTYHKGSIHPGEVQTYHVSWRWVFEVSDEQNAYDTYLGNQAGIVFPGVRVSIDTDAVANPTPSVSGSHTVHLLGEGFGCCWCCYLVWILLVVCVVMLLWIARLRRKLSKLERKLQSYEVR